MSEIIASSEQGSVARNAMWSGGRSGEFWQTTPAINVLMVRGDLVVSMDMFADDDLDAAVARFHELDGASPSDTAWNRADRAGRELALAIATGRVVEIRPADDIVMDDRRPLVGLPTSAARRSSKDSRRLAPLGPGGPSSKLSPSGATIMSCWRSDGRRPMTPASSSNSSPSTGSTATT